MPSPMLRPNKPIKPNCSAEFLTYVVRRSSGNSVAVVQADLSSISYAVYEIAVGNAVNSSASLVGSGSLTVSTTIFDTLQTGSAWNKTPGFNFAGKVPGTRFPNWDTTYYVKFSLTFASDGDVQDLNFLTYTEKLLRRQPDLTGA